MLRIVALVGLVLCAGACGRSAAELHARSLVAGAGTAVPKTPPPEAGEPLALDRVVARVLAVHPRLDEMRASVRAMAAMVPQEAALPDPLLEYSMAPASFGTHWGQMVSLRQMFPWPGSAGSRAQAALAEAEAMSSDLDGMRLMLAAQAAAAVFDLGSIPELRRIVRDHHALVETMRYAALGRIAAGRGMPAEPARAEAEKAMVERDLVGFERMERVARARLHTLLQEPRNIALGPATLPARAPEAPPPVEQLVQAALERRPELDAAGHRVSAGEAGEEAASAMAKPMLGYSATFSNMEEDPLMWGQIGVMVELPFASARREGMQDEASARTARARAQVERLRDEVALEVAERHAELVAALDALAVLDRQWIPALTAEVELSVAGYTGGMGSFDAALNAADRLLSVRMQRVELLRASWMAWAMLEAAAGRLPTEAQLGAPPPAAPASQLGAPPPAAPASQGGGA